LLLSGTHEVASTKAVAFEPFLHSALVVGENAVYLITSWSGPDSGVH
jgi:hypothetical protein